MSDRHRELLAELEAKTHSAFAAGGPPRVEKQHRAGKLTARERIDALVDPGSFIETDRFATHHSPGLSADQAVLGDGVITGHARIDGRAVCLFAQDFTVFGGALGAAHARNIVKVMDLALKIGVPVLGVVLLSILLKAML